MDTTTDGFLDNAFRIVQPKRGGHRAGLDAVLLAATVPAMPDETVADFGSGSGAAGLAVAQRCAGVRVLLIENEPTMARFARETLALAANAPLAPRLRLHEADALAPLPAPVHHAIANPPYNDAARQPSPSALKAHAHQGDDLLRWLDAMLAALHPGGSATMILRPDALPPLIERAAKSGRTTILPVTAKPDTAPIRALLRVVAGTVGPTTHLPPIVVHKVQGPFTDEVEAILRGRASIAL
ncbi:methyltransferase [Rhizobiaceae bacterium]|nr:methyltransferase [Rhizobiaceae bacterium]